MSLFDHTVADLHEMLQKKEIKVSDLVDESFKRIQEVDDKVQAFLTLDEEKATRNSEEI